MIALAALLLVATPAPAGTAEAQHKTKVLVLDFRDDGVGADAVHIIHDTLASHLSQDPRLEVLSTDDVRRALDVDAQKRALGDCSDESCLAEVADALGAQLTVYGTAGKLGGTFVVNVSLFDAQAARSVGRETMEARTLDELPARLREAGDALVAKLPGLSPASSSGLGPIGWTGVAVGGAGVVAAGVFGVFAAASYIDVGNEAAFADKKVAQQSGDTLGSIALAGAGLAVVGAGVLVAGLILE